MLKVSCRHPMLMLTADRLMTHWNGQLPDCCCIWGFFCGFFYFHRCRICDVRCVYSFGVRGDWQLNRFVTVSRKNNNVAFVGLVVLTRIDTCVLCACKINAYLIKQSEFVQFDFAYDIRCFRGKLYYKLCFFFS